MGRVVRAEANRTGHEIKFDGRTGGQTNGGRVCFLRTLNIPDDDDFYSIETMKLDGLMKTVVCLLIDAI